MNIYQCPVCGKVFKKFPSQANQSGCCSPKCFYNPNYYFWSKVIKTESCWIWNGFVGEDGYGQFGFRGKNWRAHRFSWFLSNGPIPGNLQVLHDCPDGDDPLCVNPNHLWLGTPLENVADAIAKNRMAVGSKAGLAKLNEETVKALRYRYAVGNVRQIDLAKEYGVSQAVISAVVLRKTWKHV